MTGETAVIIGGGYTVTLYVNTISHTLDKQLKDLQIPNKGSSDTLTYLIDLRKCKEAVTINGYLLDNPTTSGLTQKGYLIALMRSVATNLTLTWGVGGTYEAMTGNIAKADIKEEPGRLLSEFTNTAGTPETKIFSVQLVFMRGTFKG